MFNIADLRKVYSISLLEIQISNIATLNDKTSINLSNFYAQESTVPDQRNETK